MIYKENITHLWIDRFYRNELLFCWLSKESLLFASFDVKPAYFRSCIQNSLNYSVLPQTYRLLGRDFYAEILEAHMADRRKNLCDRADIAPIDKGTLFIIFSSTNYGAVWFTVMQASKICWTYGKYIWIDHYVSRQIGKLVLEAINSKCFDWHTHAKLTLIQL